MVAQELGFVEHVLENAAQTAGVDNREQAVRTLHAFNAAARDAGDGFDPTRKDGISTLGLSPEKTNWGIRLEKPPFYAAWSTPILHDTLTGLRTNTNGEVMDIHNQVISSLYCAGESQGGFAQHGLARCLVFGRVAGRHAATRTA